uniref:Nuclear transcription factor Y subunit C-3 n=1 Tax=Anthurium amnicola TaxID=1678845 RepID=A0A1D1YJV1_9ARAE
MRQAGSFSGIAGRTGPHALPLARIKKIMKGSGEEVKMISGEAPLVFAKACELFIQELTRRSWAATLRGKRRTLHRDDVAAAVADTDVFDFLVGMVAELGGGATGADDPPEGAE